MNLNLTCRLMCLRKLSATATRQVDGCKYGGTRMLSSGRRIPESPHPNTPLGKLDRIPPKDKNAKDTVASTNVYEPFPDATNPQTGEVGGPAGPEPTRYGDWERKGRVSDF